MATIRYIRIDQCFASKPKIDRIAVNKAGGP